MLLKKYCDFLLIQKKKKLILVKFYGLKTCKIFKSNYFKGITSRVFQNTFEFSHPIKTRENI